MNDWTAKDVILWTCSLSLSQRYRLFSPTIKLQLHNSYCQILQSNDVNGKVLQTMKTKEDWRELGIVSFGDLRIIANAPVPTDQVNSSPSNILSNAHKTAVEGVRWIVQEKDKGIK